MLSVPDFAKKQIIFVFTKEGDKISFSNENVIVKNKEGKIKHQSTCYRLFMLCIVGHMSVTSGLLQRANKFGFTICLMTVGMRVYQVINGYGEGNTIIRSRQYEYTGLEIGKIIINNKIKSQYKALQTIRYRNDVLNEAIATMKKHSQDALEAENRNELLGIEGSAARVYFPQIYSNVQWKRR
ncbi:MAG TPA: CRISPR-associated endonuclease Cas1 [Candidatus Dorea intestinavium]|nr:CRISPR-associated endonuclease Cas1 [Candidatus Dorea intestinavium]